MSALLEGRGLTVRIRGRALLDDVTLSAAEGEVVAVVGPNGAGKSTLIGALAGDRTPDAGRVMLAGEPLAAMPPRRRALLRAVLPQSWAMEFTFTVAEVVGMGRAPHRRGLRAHAGDAAAVSDALDAVGIADLADRTVPTLSGGERARVGLARVLAQDTPVVLLDEPTAALDLRHQQQVMQVARDLATRGRLVVAVVHDLSLAAAWADRVALLDGGRLVALGTPWEVLRPEIVAGAFGQRVRVLRHPVRDAPLVVADPG